MQQLTNAQRAYLRRLAHDIRPIVQIGKGGVTDNVRLSVDRALSGQELIKIKFLDFQDQKQELTDDLVEFTGSALIGIVGNIATLYRQQPDPDRRKIELPD
jgi:RNA-binding protein